MLARANAAGIRLIILPVNDWRDCGGVPQYLDWCAFFLALTPGGPRDPAAALAVATVGVSTAR